MANKFWVFLLVVISVTQMAILNPVNAYTLFTDREAWLTAVSGLPLLEENFNNIPNGEYPAGTIPSDVFTNLELFPALPLPMAIEDGEVVPVFNRDFSVQMLFFQPVLAAGLDIINPENANYQYNISEEDLGGAFSFNRSAALPTPDFLGWVADEGDNPVLQTFVFFDPNLRDQFAWDNLVVAAVPVPATVDIDIKPGNKRNVINPRSKGGIWVAVLSDTDPESPFDPSSQVDIPTVEFGPDGAKATRYKVKDINKDGLGDLLLRFKIQKTGIACGDTEATLTGETFDGLIISGTDSIKTVGCKPKKCYKKKHHTKHPDDDCDNDEKHHGKHNEKEHHERHHSKHHDDDRDDDHHRR